MNIIPLVSIKKGKLLDGKNGEPLSVETLFSSVEKDSMLYVLDYDGIEHNNPALELYQRLTEHCVLWIDDGPRRIDDVMDTIMAGATNLTLRSDLWPDLDIPAVQELTDDEIYIKMSSHQNKARNIPFFSDNIGMILFDDEADSLSFSKETLLKHTLYLYTGTKEKVGFWDEQGITGILIDLNKKEGSA